MTPVRMSRQNQDSSPSTGCPSSALLERYFSVREPSRLTCLTLPAQASHSPKTTDTHHHEHYVPPLSGMCRPGFDALLPAKQANIGEG
ncbi:hypothetical protein LZ30DRAFT_707980 [Colletotrichum cereale]|nr:hypothetical protein LZ30DRAFT_707980 [Colletotrichum cereale]